MGQTIGWHTIVKGHYPDADPPREWSPERNVVWKTKMPGPSYASPVVLADRLFVLSQPAELFCIQLADGKVRWQRTHTYLEAFGEAKAKEIADGQEDVRRRISEFDQQIARLRAEQRQLEKEETPTADKKVTELRVQMGQLQNRKKQIVNRYATIPKYDRLLDAGNAACTPVTDGKHVYSVFATGIVSCHTIDGERRWMRFVESSRLRFGHASSPVLVSDKLIVHLVDLVALNAETGEEVWRVKLDPRHVTPLSTRIGDSDVLLVAGGTLVRTSDGKVLKTKLYGGAVANPIIHDGTIFVQQSSMITALRLSESTGDDVSVDFLWGADARGARGFTQIPTPLYHSGLLYSVNSAGILDLTDAKTGERIYRKRLLIGEKNGPRHRFYPSPVLAGDLVFISANNGDTLVLSPGREFQEVAVNHLEPFTSTPVFVGKRMYVRGEEHLYCIGK